MSLSDKFTHATDYVKNLPKDGPVQLGNDDKLKFYGFFKQATVGDVEGSQPWAVQVEARAKWDAWNANKGMSKDEAMEKYIALLTEKYIQKQELCVRVVTALCGRFIPKQEGAGGEYKPL